MGEHADDTKYLLSDGRDARDIVRALERVSTGAEEPAAAPGILDRIAATLIPTVVPAAGIEVWSTSETLLKDATDDDREKVLHAANERWGESRRQPGTAVAPLEFWRKGMATQLRSGAGIAALAEQVAEGLRELVTAASGRATDTRDAETIAEQFVHRVEGLARLRGDEATDENFGEARDDVLRGVSDHYRRKVLERILDREEAIVREDSPGDAEQLFAMRDERREHGWRALTGRSGGGRTR